MMKEFPFRQWKCTTLNDLIKRMHETGSTGTDLLNSLVYSGPLCKKGKAKHLYSALHGIQTALKRSGMDHTAFNLQRTPCQP